MIYGIAAVSAEWLDVIVEIDGQVLEPMMSFLAICFVVAICVAIGFFVTVSLVGVVVFAIAAAIIGVVFAGSRYFGLCCWCCSSFICLRVRLAKPGTPLNNCSLSSVWQG